MRRMFRFVAFSLFAAAIATELSKPAAERTWHGRVLDVVPYDFRPPTWQRIRNAYWDSSSDRLFNDRVFGVGWAVNLYRAKTLMEDVFRRLMRTQEPLPIRMSLRSRQSTATPEVSVSDE